MITETLQSCFSSIIINNREPMINHRRNMEKIDIEK